MLFKSVKFAKTALAAIMFFTGLLVASCGNPDQDSQQKSDSASGTVSSSNTDMKPALDSGPTTEYPVSPLTTAYLALAQKSFKGTCESITQLNQSVNQFVSEPSKDGLESIKKLWLTSHNQYTSTQLFRNINIKHPVLDQSTIPSVQGSSSQPPSTPVQHALAIRIDQYPLLPGYIDEIKGYPKSGYIFSTLPIDRETLNTEHQFADSHYVVLGFHAIEFLLWGEGNRTYADFLTPPENPNFTPDTEADDILKTEDSSRDSYKARRSQLLSLTTNILTEDINTLCKEWNLDSGFYTTTLKSLPTKDQNIAISTAAEQFIANIQIDTAKIRQSNEKAEEDLGIETLEIISHSEFSNSDKDNVQAQINMLKSLIETKEWIKLSKEHEHTMKLTTLAKALLL